MLTRSGTICVILVSLFFFVPIFGQTAPSITSLSPSIGPVPPAGGPVTIQGANFGTQPGTVTFGGTAVAATSWSDKSIVVTLPATLPVGSLAVVVTVNGLTSNAQSFLLIPTIIQDSPAQASVGTPIKISGTSFGDQQGSSTVTFNSIAATPTSWSNTSITAPVPVGAADGALVVTVNGFQTNGVSFPIVPNILSLTPNSGVVGTSVTITGTGFGASPGFGGVTFNGVSATITSGAWSDGTILVAVPSGATTGNVVVTAGNSLSSSGVPFTLPPTLVSLALSPSNPSIALNSVQQLKLTATGTFSDNSTQDLTASVTWNTSNPSVAQVMPIHGVFGVVGTSSVGTATITATQGSVSANTVVTVTPQVTPVKPNITSVSPSSGTAGTLVMVQGSNFGTQPGSVWLGTTLGTIVSWGDQQVTATVNTGASSGTVKIQQASQLSNPVPFTVVTTNIQSVTPSNGVAGTPVMITGSGFGATQLNGQVWLGTAPGVVTSWSDGLIQATVAQGSATGEAQVLQNGVLSNPVAFTVNVPQITSLTPSAGSAGSTVTITGSGFGTSQGASGVVWIGSTPGNVVSWSDVQVQATVASNAVSGIVKIEQNGIWSNAVRFTVPVSGGGTAVTLSPSILSMVVGESRSLQALDSSFKPVIGLTWVSSDTTVATLSTDDPPIITAIGTGHVSISAGSSSSDITVYAGPILPPGTPEWSIPGGSSGVVSLAPAVPSDTGVADVFAFDASGNVSAIQRDGTVAWTTNVGSNTHLVFLPDFLGGLVVVDTTPNVSNTIQRLDGVTGLSGPSYTFINSPSSGSLSPDPRPVRLFPDGTILAVDGDTVFGIDPQSMTTKFSLQLDDTLFMGGNGVILSRFLPDIGSIIIAGDGYAYIVYHNFINVQDSADNGNLQIEHHEDFTRVLRIGPAGDSIKIPVTDHTADSQFNDGTEVTLATESGYLATPGNLITNADQGALLGLELDTPAYNNGIGGNIPASTSFSLVLLSASGASQIPLNLPDQASPIISALQAEDGTFLGQMNIANPSSTQLVAFDQSGNLKWSAPAADYSPQYADSSDNLVATSASTGAFVTFDPSGNVVSRGVSPGAVYSWTDNWYNLTPVGAQSVSFPALNWGSGFEAFAQGNRSRTHTSIRSVSFQKQIVLDSGGTITDFGNLVLEGIALNKTETVKLLPQASASGQLTLSIQDVGSDGSAIFVNDNSGNYTVSADGKSATVQLGPNFHTVLIKGGNVSKKADNIVLKANTTPGTTIGSQKFSIVSVAITMRAQDSDFVSHDDLGDDAYARDTGQTLNPPMSQAALGHLITLFPNDNAGCGIGAEFVGNVTPPDYKGQITIRRQLLARNKWFDQPQPGQTNPDNASMVDDTSRDVLTKDVQPDKDSQGNPTGTVYDLDAPGAVGSQLLLTAERYRGNFREYAELGDWVRNDPASAAEQASDDFFWFSRSSCTAVGTSGLRFEQSYQSQGDNTTGGATGPRVNGTNCTPISVDLSGSCP